MAHWDSKDPIRFGVFLALFVGAALLKGRIPGLTGTYSPVFFLALVGSHALSFSEAVLQPDWPEWCDARFSCDVIHLRPKSPLMQPT